MNEGDEEVDDANACWLMVLGWDRGEWDGGEGAGDGFFRASIALVNFKRGPILNPISFRWSDSNRARSENSTSFSLKILL